MTSCTQKTMDIVDAIDKQDILSFREALKSCDDLNIRLNPYSKDTYLTLACRKDNAHEFVQELLEAGADPKLSASDRAAPVHIAAEKCNVKALKLVLADPRTDVNQLDAFGNTALHSLCKGEAEPAAHAVACLKILLARPDLKVNSCNRKGKTALVLAAERKHKGVIREMVTFPNVDLDRTDAADERTARDIIRVHFPDMELPPQRGSSSRDDDVSNLFPLLAKNNVQSFEILLNKLLEKENDQEKQNILNFSDGSSTLLQDASFNGLTNFVELLLEKGADPNVKPTSSKSPLILAASSGHYDILKLLLTKSDCKIPPTVLHELIGNFKFYKDKENFRKCFQLLLENKDIAINAVDTSGNTALHFANGDEYFVMELIAHGASIAIRNNFGKLALEKMNSTTLKKVLDARLKHESEGSSLDSGLLIDYRFLEPVSSTNVTKSQEIPYTRNSNYVAIQIGETGAKSNNNVIMVETEPVLYISRSPCVRHLLKHPVFTSYVALKWRGAQQLYMINLVFYIIFVLSLTAYLLLGYAYAPTSIRNSGNDSNSSQHAQETITDRIALYTEVPLWWIILILSMCLILRELTQAVVSFRLYFSYSENYIELLLILFTALILFYESAEAEVRPHLSSVTIFLCWTELVLLTGRHPQQSTNIEMLKVVSKSFLKYLYWFFIIIVAFAIVFYILFVSDDSFRNPAQSLFKTMIMATGEFDLGDVEMTYPVTSHVLFILFMFFVAIVLLNLLNGLAVSDTQAIKSDAELFAIVSRVKLISYAENILLGRPIWCRRKHESESCSCWKLSKIAFVNTFITNKLLLFPELLPNKLIRLLPPGPRILNTKHDDRCTSGTESFFKSCVLDPDLFDIATGVLTEKVSEIEAVKQELTLKIEEIKHILLAQKSFG